MKEVYREVRQPFNEEGGLHFSCVWKLKVIPCIPLVESLFIGIDFRAENELLVSRNLLPLSQCFFMFEKG